VIKLKNKSGIITAIYSIAIISGSIWVQASLFDPVSLRELEAEGAVEYDKHRAYVRLTEKGVGIQFFGRAEAGKAAECL
jgi:hypothetical protein